MEKLYPDMTGKRVERVTVQQQNGANDCGLFARAFLDLLSQANKSRPVSTYFQSVDYA